MKEITVQELKKMLDNNEDFQLIDVREPEEYEVSNLKGELIPVGRIMDSVDKIATDKTVIIQCRSGARSGNAVLQLESVHGFTNLYNLKGGIKAWAAEIEPGLPVA